MGTTDTIVIGAGQAGLAMSRCLTDRGVDHVVLERGRVAERWRSDVWDSLRLLSPNWMTRLPGWRYDGSDPDGFMSVAATHAALLLAQGAGRLIRTTADKGVVAILDPRLVTARYGRFLADSLPPMWRTTDRATVLTALQRLAAS